MKSHKYKYFFQYIEVKINQFAMFAYICDKHNQLEVLGEGLQ